MLDAASSVHLWALERYDKEFLAQGSKDKKEFLQYLYNYALKKFQDSEIELGITALLEYYEFVRITDAEELFNVLKAYFFDISRSSQFRNIIDFILLDPSNQFLKKHQINFIKFDNFLHEYVEDVLPKLLTVDSDEAIMTYNKIFHTRNFIHDTINKYDLHLKTKQELLFIFNESERLVANKSIIVKILDFTHKLNIHLDSKFDLYKRILIYIKDKGYDRHPNSEIFLFVACIQYEIEKLNKELNKEFLLKINKELIKGIPLLVKYLVFESNLFIFDNSNNFHFLLPITIEVALNWYKDIPIKTANSMSGFNWNNAPTLGTDNKKILINDHNWSVAQYRLPQKWLSGYKISRIDGGKFLETLTGEKNFWSIQKLPLQNVAGENIKESIFFKKTISPSPLKEKEIYGLSA